MKPASVRGQERSLLNATDYLPGHPYPAGGFDQRRQCSISNLPTTFTAPQSLFRGGLTLTNGVLTDLSTIYRINNATATLHVGSADVSVEIGFQDLEVTDIWFGRGNLSEFAGRAVCVAYRLGAFSDNLVTSRSVTIWRRQPKVHCMEILILYKYDYAAQIMDIGPHGLAHGVITDLHVYLNVILNTSNTSDITVALQDLKLEHAG
uniref:Uncharacterized protein n=1 Tax=Timema poppense TaxID=170557 RepID=A0A7R9HE88_TIMPO|nr:unnamed protein product [Timema poppensis]